MKHSASKEKTKIRAIYKIITCFVLLVSGGIGAYLLLGNKVTEAKTPYIEISQEQLKDRISNQKETVVYYYKKDCSYCKQANPLVKQAIKSFKVEVYHLDVEKYDGIWDERSIVGTPTIVWYKGGYEISRLEGIKTQDLYNRWFKAMKNL